MSDNSVEKSFLYLLVLSLLLHLGVGALLYYLPQTRPQPKEPVFVDTVFGGCYKKDVFRRVGLFNEALIKHQDMEFNCRLRAVGGRILLAPDIVCYYYARTDIKAFLAHNWGNGLSVVMSLLESRAVPVSSRHFVPMTFVMAIICSLVFSVLYTAFAWLLPYVEQDALFKSMAPGASALQVMRCGASSTASARIKPSRPDLEAET